MRTSRRACSSFVLAGHPVLRRVATPVRGVAARADLPRLDATLRSALGEHYGVAAPQLGTSARVFLLRAHADDEPWIAINPSIQRRSREMVAGWETCLSVPGYAASVERPAAVDVRYERLDGTAVERRLRGFEARAFQHELDHLDGILFTDKCARCLHRRRGPPLSPPPRAPAGPTRAAWCTRATCLAMGPTRRPCVRACGSSRRSTRRRSTRRVPERGLEDLDA